MHAVFGAGLDLLGRLEQGHTPNVENERQKLLGLVQGDSELQNSSMYVGDQTPAVGRGGAVTGPLGNVSGQYLGVRYALACWADEVMLRFAPPWWADRWESDTLEVRLYGGAQERAWRFWEQAKRAEGKGGPEALEAYLWAVMLGFRGEPDQAAPPVVPKEWVDGVRRRVLQVRQGDFPLPVDRDTVTRVPPLRGRQKLRAMLRAFAVVLAAGVFLLALSVTAGLRN